MPTYNELKTEGIICKKKEKKKSVTCSGMFNKNIPTELIILRLSVNYIINWLVPTSTLLWLG